MLSRLKPTRLSDGEYAASVQIEAIGTAFSRMIDLLASVSSCNTCSALFSVYHRFRSRCYADTSVNVNHDVRSRDSDMSERFCYRNTASGT